LFSDFNIQALTHCLPGVDQQWSLASRHRIRLSDATSQHVYQQELTTLSISVIETSQQTLDDEAPLWQSGVDEQISNLPF
jgi:hypothetical protein